MNVYDFDKTIYQGDSTLDFCIFLCRRHPQLARFWPRQAWAFTRYLFGALTKTQFKERLFSMFAGVEDMDHELNLFWQEHLPRIKRYYRYQRRIDDVIISASPAFLLQPVCRMLGVRHLLASQVNPRNGAYDGLNCFGDEKVRRFLEAGYCCNDMECFYSDSHSDTPLARLAQEAYLVLGDEILPWQTRKPHWLKQSFTRLWKAVVD